MNDLPQNATRERIMDTAEKLFMSHGYSAVKLRDIADAVGMKHASLYYYVPKGKDQLYAEVVRRSMKRHNEQMSAVVRLAGDDFQAQLYALGDWFLSQPPLNLARMSDSDLTALPPELTHELRGLIMYSLNQPILNVLQNANESGVADIEDIGMASMLLLTGLQGLHSIPKEYSSEPIAVFGRKLINMLLSGWLIR